MFESLNRPPFLIGGAVVAILANALGWIAFEYTLICVAAAAVGLFLYYRRKT